MITLDRELNTKLIQKNNLTSTAHESQLKDKQKFHSAQKQTPSQYQSYAQLTVIAINNLNCSIIYILKHRSQHLLV
jgi:hypothetical protein